MIRFFAAGLMAISLFAVAQAAEKSLEGITCPLSGAPVKADKTAEYMGKTVYFCCGNCPKAFSADTDKFALKATKQLLETDQITQVACPISGQPINADTAVKFGEAEVAFCCSNCQAKFKGADDAGKLKIAFGDFDKGFTLQTACPVSGKPIKAEHSVEYKGKSVYFCCPNCPKAFEANPAKFVEKVPQLKAAE